MTLVSCLDAALLLFAITVALCGVVAILLVRTRP
jgi:hypothetical protein